MTMFVNVPVNGTFRGVMCMVFDHEKLDVYQLAIDIVSRSNELIKNLPKGRGYISDQLQRAALSIVLNIAEGAGKYSPRDKASFYVRAIGSTTESAAVLDVCSRLGLITEHELNENKVILVRIAQMLTKLARMTN